MVSTSKRTLILASSSPRRQELIRILGLPVVIMPSHTDENTDSGLSPHEIVEVLALRKARAVSEMLMPEPIDGIIVGSDTIVVWEGNIMNKPVDEADAIRMLTQLQGQIHEVYSGIACIDGLNGKIRLAHSKTNVRMKPLNQSQIRSYVTSGEPMDKAGSYAIQGIGATIVQSITGDYFTVVGLPLALLTDMLAEFGVHLLDTNSK